MSSHRRPPPLVARPSNNSNNNSTDSSSKPSGDSSGSPGSDPRHNKRTLIESACSACRKRKSRCNGNRPICSRCAALRTTCEYEAEAGESRWSALRRRNAVLEQERSDWENERAEVRELMTWLMTRPEPEARQLYEQVRGLEGNYMALFPLMRQLKEQFNNNQPLSLHVDTGATQLPPIRHLFDGQPSILHASPIHSVNPGTLPLSLPRDPSRDSSGSSYQDAPHSGMP